ncbi:hypothetical protein DUI87_25012 [Hirundo rustica rustica]|uniref:Uncharacterized protein n=1 Tax=Hirundo rustica rustica TaxID=333673 RepID=A0A3M0JIF8_HIRRU|nr:hypothetical protein DUI87_25012 [Hirundo rustica rustica]
MRRCQGLQLLLRVTVGTPYGSTGAGLWNSPRTIVSRQINGYATFAEKKEGSWDQSLFTLPLQGNKNYFNELTAGVTPQDAKFGAVRSIQGINPETLMTKQAGEKGESLLKTVPEVPQQVQQVQLTADKVVVGDGELTVPPSPVRGIVDGRGGSGAVSAEPMFTAVIETTSVRVPPWLICESEYSACSPYVNCTIGLPMGFYQL